MKKLLKFKNIIDLLETFPTEQHCIKYLIDVCFDVKMKCLHIEVKVVRYMPLKTVKPSNVPVAKKDSMLELDQYFNILTFH